MENQIPTTEELLKDRFFINERVKQFHVETLKKFAELHLKAQAEAIIKITHKNGIPRIVDDEQAILNAYPLTNIK